MVSAIIVPYANGESLQLYLEEISHHVPEGRHAVVVMDQAGWHTTKKLHLPQKYVFFEVSTLSKDERTLRILWHYKQ